ncbi:MAG TPA: phosphatase PAP2 family protein [Thermomicrobiales bacterium]|jgi:undecaprenyl-diphosphatase|nr:phosphatase PAP2 family protein [Thermomicrobiales bacterium]
MTSRSLPPLTGPARAPSAPRAHNRPHLPALLTGRLTLSLALICGALALGYLLLAATVAANERPGPDVVASETLNGWSSTGMDWVMSNITHLGDSITANLLSVAMGAWLMIRARRPWAAIALVLATPAGQLLIHTLKSASARERPDLFLPLEAAGGYSFPSGHMFTAVLAWGLLAGLVSMRLPGRARWIPWGVWAVIVGSVGISRVYLGAHYASDVIASLLIGIAWIVGWLAVIGRLMALSDGRREHP